MIPSESPVQSLPPVSDHRVDPIGPIGELVEVVGPAAGTVLAAACAQVQVREPVAWIAAGPSLPHPADLQMAGVCCAALVVVRAAGVDAARAAELLLSSGGFGLVVIDGCGALPDRSVARLRALCRKHRARLLAAPWSPALSSAIDAPHLGATVALRLQACIGSHRLELQWVKNKAGLGARLPAPQLAWPVGCRPRPTRPAKVSRLPSRPPRPLEKPHVGATA